MKTIVKIVKTMKSVNLKNYIILIILIFNRFHGFHNFNNSFHSGFHPDGQFSWLSGVMCASGSAACTCEHMHGAWAAAQICTDVGHAEEYRARTT